MTRQKRLAALGVSLACLAVGLAAWVASDDFTSQGTRFFWWGLPATLISYGAVSWEQRRTLPALRWLLLCGNTSYSIYISHQLSLSAAGQAWRRAFDLPPLAATIGFGLVFLGVTGYEWYELLQRFDPRENLYLSAFFTITGLHMLHVVAGLIMLTLAYFRGRAGQFTPELQNGMEVPTAYWHLVDGVWIFVLLIVYVLPNFYQGPNVIRNPGDPFGVYDQSTITGEQGDALVILVMPESSTPAVAPSTEAAPGES